MDIFTHTWSLLVEVQFYVIVPFIFFIGFALFPTHLQIPYYFVLGMIAYLHTESQNSSENTYQKLENDEKEDYSMPKETNETNKNPLLILIFLIASFVPIEIPSEILRPGITVMTGILMVSHRKSILESRILTYFEEAAKLNRKWTTQDVSLLNVATCEYDNDYGNWWGYCKHRGINATTGKYRIMTIGNSYAASHGNLFYQECGHLAIKLSQVTFPACEPLHTIPRKSCVYSVARYEKYVRDEKPDYLFIISRFGLIGNEINTTNIEDDSIFIEMKTQIKKISDSVKYKIFVMNQIARPKGEMVHKMAEVVKEHKNLTEFDIANIDKYPKFARLRYEKMVSGCPKCELFDYNSQFFNETTGTWRFYDERNSGLSYINQQLHLTPHGLELIRPVIRGLCRRIEKGIK
uniref:SGNH domain-containing protein n=2 Tax=Caenorhabditis tropicalis TaxID=1561998 RepID=A0A1I7UI21_9PELO